MQTRTSNSPLAWLVAAVATCFAAAIGGAQPAPVEGLVRVAMLEYGPGSTGRCFSTGFLRLAAFETGIKVEQDFTHVPLGSAGLFNHPFAIMTGEKSFELTSREVENLRDYLARGGLLLASAGCSDRAWDASMRRVIERVFPEHELVELSLDHDVFHTVYDVKSLLTRQRSDARVWGVELDGRLALVYSPEGLNDTASAGGGCCCCGGNEVREAKYINANILAYALTR